MFNFGNHFSRIGQIKMADKIYNYFLENISKFESYFSKSELIIIWGNIGLHYHAIGESIKAIGYIKHGLGLLNIENEINDLPDIQNYCHFNTKLANIYEGLKDYVSAEKHYSNAHKFLKTLAMKIPELCLNTFAELLIDMSILFNLMEDEGVAKISNLITSLKIFEKEWMPVIDFQLGVCYYYLSLSQIKFLKFNEAILNLNKALELITNSKQIDNGADILINEINNELLKIESNSANSKL